MGRRVRVQRQPRLLPPLHRADLPVPTFLLPGSDKAHPAVTLDDLKVLLPGIEVLENWRGPEHLHEQLRCVLGFLDRHTPTPVCKTT